MDRGCWERILLIAGLAVLAMTSSWSSVWAHAALVDAEPAQSAVLADPPRALHLQFTEPVSLLDLHLIGPSGTAVGLRNVRALNGSLDAEVPAALAVGSYLVSYRVISADGHPVGGTVAFAVGSASIRPVISRLESGGVRVWLWCMQLVVAIGLFVGIGGTAFQSFSRMRVTAAPLATVIAGLVALPGMVVAQGFDALGRVFALTELAAAWSAGGQGGFGLVAILFALVFLSAIGARIVAPRTLSLVALAVMGLALASSGHAATASPRVLMVGMVAIHGLCAALWVGALLPLRMAILTRPGEAGRLLRPFSRLILADFILLLASGLVLAIVQVGSIAAIAGTAYGRVLLAKLTVVAVILALAWWNRYRLTPQVIRDPAASGPSMARVIGVEFVMALVVLGLVGGWRFTPPPRVLARAHHHGSATQLHADGVTVRATLEPGHAGPNDMRLQLLGGGAEPLPALEVAVSLSQPDSGIAALAATATADGSGGWRIRNLPLVVPGRWQVRVDVLVSEFRQVSLDGALDVQ